MESKKYRSYLNTSSQITSETFTWNSTISSYINDSPEVWKYFLLYFNLSAYQVFVTSTIFCLQDTEMFWLKATPTFIWSKNFYKVPFQLENVFQDSYSN